MLLFIILLLRLQGGGVARDVKPKEWESAGAALHISVHGWIDPSHIHSFIGSAASHRIGFVNSLIFDLTQCIKFPGPTL